MIAVLRKEGGATELQVVDAQIDPVKRRVRRVEARRLRRIEQFVERPVITIQPEIDPETHAGVEVDRTAGAVRGRDVETATHSTADERSEFKAWRVGLRHQRRDEHRGHCEQWYPRRPGGRIHAALPVFEGTILVGRDVVASGLSTAGATPVAATLFANAFGGEMQ
ncbi:MAG: hypothetical protein IPJ97_16415 [Proteobacteria bacterium]|nr:hypothetical protein [Pseudomonadota bacterium]